MEEKTGEKQAPENTTHHRRRWKKRAGEPGKTSHKTTWNTREQELRGDEKQGEDNARKYMMGRRGRRKKRKKRDVMVKEKHTGSPERKRGKGAGKKKKSIPARRRTPFVPYKWGFHDPNKQI